MARGMIPGWKVRRETTRLVGQITGLPAALYNLPKRLSEPKRRAEYERNFDKLTKVDEGNILFGKKLAIYLIYQPTGIVKSSLMTLDWLVSHGYSPIVVANSEIHQRDMLSLLSRVSLLLRRPNFGYDFGGYKDGIRLINRYEANPERVIIMNDSIWLPMGSNLMSQLEERRDLDVVGLLEDEKINHDAAGGRPSGRKHIESYFYMVGAAAWKSDAFQTFWRDYKMTDIKSKTIRFGEIGFTQTMAQAGLTTGALTSREEFLAKLSARDDQFLATALAYASYGDTDLRNEGHRLKTLEVGGPDWRDQVYDHMRRCVNRKRFNTTLCFANDKLFGTLFMKKNREVVFVEMRKSYLNAVDAGILSAPPAEILDEIRALVG